MLLKTQSCSSPLWCLRWEPVCQAGCRQCPTVWQLSSWCGSVYQCTHSVPVSVHTFVEACRALSSSELGRPGKWCALAHPPLPEWLWASVLPIQNGQSELAIMSRTALWLVRPSLTMSSRVWAVQHVKEGFLNITGRVRSSHMLDF